MSSQAVCAAAARGIRVQPTSPDPWGNTWQAVIHRRGRASQPLACVLAGSADAAARAALQYVGARGWQ